MYTIATHNGRFHSDDVLAVATLGLLYGRENIRVLRTRDESEISLADIVLDVGGVYDHSQKRYDHHQPGSPVRENGIPYAAFGLIWKHYGAEVSGSLAVAATIEQTLCLPVDAGDNAVSLYELNKYGVSPFELYNIIGSYVPTSTDADYDSAFWEAVDFATLLLRRLIVKAKDQEIVNAYIKTVYEEAIDRSVLVFDRSVSRNALVGYPEVKVIVYPATDKGGQAWRASVVPVDYDSFNDRVSFPKEWAGLNDGELASVSGIEDAIFCHKGRYLFGAKSIESAVKGAKLAK